MLKVIKEIMRKMIFKTIKFQLIVLMTLIVELILTMFKDNKWQE